jgi:hypothetical protein
MDEEGCKSAKPGGLSFIALCDCITVRKEKIHRMPREHATFSISLFGSAHSHGIAVVSCKKT